MVEGRERRKGCNGGEKGRTGRVSMVEGRERRKGCNGGEKGRKEGFQWWRERRVAMVEKREEREGFNGGGKEGKVSMVKERFQISQQ